MLTSLCYSQIVFSDHSMENHAYCTPTQHPVAVSRFWRLLPTGAGVGPDDDDVDLGRVLPLIQCDAS